MTIGRPKLGQEPISEGYQIRKAKRKNSATIAKAMVCMKCGSTFFLKSNKAVWEELERIGRYLVPPVEPSCPNPDCENHAQGAISKPWACYPDGKTPTGSQRWKCRLC